MTKIISITTTEPHQESNGKWIFEYRNINELGKLIKCSIEYNSYEECNQAALAMQERCIKYPEYMNKDWKQWKNL